MDAYASEPNLGKCINFMHSWGKTQQLSYCNRIAGNSGMNSARTVGNGATSALDIPGHVNQENTNQPIWFLALTKLTSM